MQSVPDPPRLPLFCQCLRWACVLPAAIVSGLFAGYAVGMTGFALRVVAPSAADYWRQFGVPHFIRSAAFVFVGAALSPRYRIATALVLAVAKTGLALKTHVLIDCRVGFTNYAHFTAEMLGAACGIACLVAFMRCRRSSSPRGGQRIS